MGSDSNVSAPLSMAAGSDSNVSAPLSLRVCSSRGAWIHRLAKEGPSATPRLVRVARKPRAALGWERGPSVLCRAACFFRCLRWGVVGTPMPGWRASYTTGHVVAFGRPMSCVRDARAQPIQALRLESGIQAAEDAALDRGGTLPPLPEPGCASPLG